MSSLVCVGRWVGVLALLRAAKKFGLMVFEVGIDFSIFYEAIVDC